MKKLLYILLIFSTYILLSGRSCEDDDVALKMQEEQVSAAKDSILREFGTDYLAEEARHAAEVNAVQKLKDLAEYVEIYTDVSMDSLFRAKAGEMIRDMFVSAENRLFFGKVIKEKIKPVTLKEFLEKGFGDDYSTTDIIFDSIRVKEPLVKSGDELYLGKLTAFQTVNLHSVRNNVQSYSLPITINFISSRQMNVIGRDTIRVWSVYLGDFEESSKD